MRLALSGQLGADAFTSDAMFATMDLCVSCKGCKRECPTGVDMAKMKIEFLAHYRRRHALRVGERLTAYLPRYAPFASRLGPLLNLRDRVAGAAALSERWLGLSAKRRLPQWRRYAFASEQWQVASYSIPPIRPPITGSGRLNAALCIRPCSSVQRFW